MKNTGKRMISIVAATALLGGMVAFAGCSGSTYKGTKLDYSSEGTVSSNGGFAVEKGDYVYFINGVADYTDSNKYGDVEKGALMRISKTDLSAGKNSAETVVPALFVAQNFNSGIYIYGDYVYFATPTTSKDSKGEVQNSMLDFKRAKLDGSEMMKDYYFRLESNTANYRFVEEDGVVYCMYEEDGALKSFNTKTKKTSVLVKGASAYVYDTKDLSNPNVYYTMSVTYDADSKNPSTPEYNQLYSVNAAATATTDKAKAAYTTADGKTYDFDEKYLKEQNEKAEKGEEPYDLSDYSTYPYVNLGKLVLDGRGWNSKVDDKFTWNSEEAFTPDGYTYTISSYQNGGVYFTRADVNNAGTGNTKLYYLADENGGAKEWNTVTGNQSDKMEVVALDTTNATSSAIFLYENGKHEYLYVADETLYKESAPVGGKTEKIALAYKVGTPTLYKTEGDYLYYFATGTNGNNLSLINYKGNAEDYNVLLNKEAYQPTTLAIVDWNSSWYKPEIIGDTLMYSNAQTFGSLSYNYVYTAKLGDVMTINENNKAYEDVQEYITDGTESDEQTAMQYYFRNAGEAAEAKVKELFDAEDDAELLEVFNAFVEKVKANEFKSEKDFINFIGKQTKADVEDIEEGFANSMKPAEEETTEEKGLETWAIVLIVVGSVLVVAGAAFAVIYVLNKKKASKKAEEEATVNAYKKKVVIDTTDDKSIDVYATEEEEKEEEASEEAEESAQEEEEAVEEEINEEATEEVTTDETQE